MIYIFYVNLELKHRDLVFLPIARDIAFWVSELNVIEKLK